MKGKLCSKIANKINVKHNTRGNISVRNKSPQQSFLTKFPHSHYFFLTVLHMLGLIHVPNRARSQRLNTLHKVYYYVVHSLIISFNLLCSVSLFVRSTQDFMEFLQKLLEVVTMGVLYTELVHITTHLNEVISLIEIMEEWFLTSYPCMVEDYQRQTRWATILMTMAVASLPLNLILVTVVPSEQRELDLIRYKFKVHLN